MPTLTGSGVKLVGLAAAVPKNREDNQDLEGLSEKSRDEIIKQVGIRYRHVAKEDITASDLCTTSAQQLLEKLNWKAEDVGLLVFVSQTPDHIVPGSATQIQNRLGLKQDAVCIDINQGCAGYVYGMSVITAMMQAYQIQKALLLVGDTITKMVSKGDNSIRPIFSDAGTATAFELDSSSAEMYFKLGSNGSDYEAIHIADGGYRNPINAKSLKPEVVSDGIIRQANHLSMNGQAVFTFGLSTVSKSITELLAEQNVSPDSVDFIVLHQANQLLNNSIVRKAGFTPEQAPSSLYNYGNTSCATIPVTLVAALSEQLKTKRLKLLISGFGVGLSWGNVILETENVTCLPMIQV